MYLVKIMYKNIRKTHIKICNVKKTKALFGNRAFIINDVKPVRLF